MIRPVLLCILSALFIAAPLTAQIPEAEFRSIGPFGGHVLDLVVDPTGSRVFASTVNAGVFVSTDNGKSWSPSREGLPREIFIGGYERIEAIAVDPVDGRLYAGGGAIFSEVYISDNNGLSWQFLSTPEGTRGGIHGFWIDPEDNNVIVASNGPLGKGVFVSTDRGLTWAASNTGLPSERIDALCRLPEDNTVFFVVSNDVLYKSENQGASWAEVGALPAQGFRDLVLSTGQSGSMYLATEGGCFVSTDSGQGWTRMDEPTLEADVYRFAEGAVSTLAIGRGGVFPVTSNSLIESKVDFLYTRINDVAALPSGDLVVATEMGVFGGGSKTFSAEEELAFQSKGILATDIAAIYAVPGTDAIYAGAGVGYDGGLFYSPDGGVTWEHRAVGLKNPDIRSMAVSPSNPEVVYLGTADASDDFGENGTIYRSRDGGKTWTDVSGELPHEGNRIIISMLVHPTDPDIVWASVQSKFGGMYKTTNGGQNWTRVSDGLEHMPPMPGFDDDFNNAFLDYYAMLSLAIDPEDYDRVYIGAGGCWGGVYISENSGNSWTRYAGEAMEVDTEVPNPMMFGVHLELFDFDISPINPNHMIASGARGAFPGGEFEGSDQIGVVFQSFDRGETWSIIRDRGRSDYFTSPVTGIVIDPANEGRLYAATREGIKVSEQGGADGSWAWMNEGLSESELFSRNISMRADDPTQLFMATALTGIWVREVNPTPVRLTAFEVRSESDRVRVSWSIADPTNHLGFYVDREIDGERVRLTTDLLQGRSSYEWIDASPVSGVSNRYTVVELSRDGMETDLASEDVLIPLSAGLVLGPPVPNPIRARSQIRFQVDRQERVRIRIFDAQGRKVTTLLEQTLTAGTREVYWDRTDDQNRLVAPGVYFMQLEQGNRFTGQKLMVLP